MNSHEIIISKADNGLRIDAVVSTKIPELSRSYCKKLIKDGKVLCNNTEVKPSYLVCENDIIKVIIEKPKEVGLIAQDIPLNIVYEDDDIIVVNKSRGMVVHPSPGHADGTLVNALLFHCKTMPTISGELRPGIVHRIDKDTTGLLVVAKNDTAHVSLSRQLKEKTAGRKYKALVEGVIKEDAGEVLEPIARHKKDRKKMAVVADGKVAHTKFAVEKRYKNNTLLDITLMTGRTHQIRVHLTHIKHPVIGDSVYGYKRQKFNLDGQLLHAYELSLDHPKTDERMTFSAPLPEDFMNVLNKIN
ncbi:MAG: RluA family pseudouridine synthase [Clostridiales bacterium]|nr:RluA family pseudouridine synthase [Clostridiales bacterium]